MGDASLSGKSRLLPALFGLTLFVSAGLLFVVEPMIAKMVLPLMGGTPAVWNTCMMFFQALVLAGYLYAHLSSSRLQLGRQVLLHGAILLAACVFLPLSVSRRLIPSGETNPAGVVLVLLLASVGLPFFVLASSAPLLQKWFVRTGHHTVKDPYFLYSAGNVGSMAALISYPTIIEPGLPLKEQSLFWGVGFGLLIALTVSCAYFALRNKRHPDRSADADGSTANTEHIEITAPPDGLQRLRWIALSFVPSSLMIGLTSFLSTDVAAIPLFWVIPLSFYLLSFILVFANMPRPIHRILLRVAPAAIIAIMFINIPMTKPDIWIIFSANLAVFFIVAMACHGELAMSRPSTQHLTEFYLWMSAGGVMGGVFNALVAPMVFTSITEYPMAFVLAAFLVPLPRGKTAARRGAPADMLLDFLLPALLGVITFWLIAEWPLWNVDLPFFHKLSKNAAEKLRVIITYGIPALVCFGLFFMKRRLRSGLGVAAIALAIIINSEWKEDIVHKERSFFGVIKVSNDSEHEYRWLVHGTTQHGKQSLDPSCALEPLTYYHRQGPIGQVFGAFSGARRKTDVALVGLGAGTLASYGRRGQHLTFYEIDPAIKRIATDPSMFTYMQGCKADWKVIIGDARLKLEEAGDGKYGLIVIDAFSSDAIPVHLLTREALKLYVSKLDATGVLAIHISNKYLDLEPVIERLSRDAGLAALSQNDNNESTKGKYRSHWVIMARKEADFSSLRNDARWVKLRSGEQSAVWTDDFSNVLSVFRWKKF